MNKIKERFEGYVTYGKLFSILLAMTTLWMSLFITLMLGHARSTNAAIEEVRTASESRINALSKDIDNMQMILMEKKDEIAEQQTSHLVVDIPDSNIITGRVDTRSD